MFSLQLFAWFVSNWWTSVPVSEWLSVPQCLNQHSADTQTVGGLPHTVTLMQLLRLKWPPELNVIDILSGSLCSLWSFLRQTDNFFSAFNTYNSCRTKVQNVVLIYLVPTIFLPPSSYSLFYSPSINSKLIPEI